MSASSDFNMLRLEAPWALLQITNDEEPEGEAMEVANPLGWMWAIANHQHQAEQDLRRLVEVCGNSVDRTDQRIRRIEEAYNRLSQGTQYVYERIEAKEQIAEEWVSNELMVGANAYQTFARQVWEAIIELMQEAEVQRWHQATQVTRMHDAVAFLGEANLARNRHLAEFQGNVEKWEANYQQKVETLEQQRAEDQTQVASLEQQLARAQDEIQRMATIVPLPASPAERRWTRLPSVQSLSTSPSPPAPDALRPLRAAPATRLMLGSPLNIVPQPPTRRQRPPAIPTTPPGWAASSPLRGPLEMGETVGGQPPTAQPLRRSPTPLSPLRPLSRLFRLPSTQPSPSRPPPQGPTPQELVQLVAEGVARAQMYGEPRRETIRTYRLKMENPEKFDGKSPTAFNQWWESVTMYLGFYPDMIDRQKIAWVGTLLTDTALVWHLHRYRELRDNDTWVNYSAAIKTKYHNQREAVDAQLKLGQLKYKGSICAYMTEFRALNNFARATGEAPREKVDLAMPDALLDMRFAHYLEDLADDEGFLQATYQAGLQVEKKKVLKQAREQARNTGPTGSGKRDDERKRENKKDGKLTEKRPEKGEREVHQRKDLNKYGGTGRWASEGAAFEGVPASEKWEHTGTQGCHCCGRNGYRVAYCFAATTIKGTDLPSAPWKVAGATETGKRRRTEDAANENIMAPKQQKVGAVETMESDDHRELPMWANSSEELDF